VSAVRRCRALLAALLLTLAGAPAFAATITIQVGDAAGEGFNDPTPFTPIGGNAATTLGQARLNVFNEAGRIWGLLLAENVNVVVKATFDPLTCSATTGTLGSAGPDYIYLRNGYWYPGPLYVALGGGGGSQATISAQFNSDVGTQSTCLGGKPFYYGFDHTYSRSTYVADLLEVVMHELGHGLGFISFVDQSGAGTADSKGVAHLGVFDQFIYDETQGLFWNQMTAAQRATSALNDGHLVWNGQNVNNAAGFLTAGRTSPGGHVRLYAPTTWDDGSSVSHWDTTASPNLLMEPYATGSTRGYTDLTTCVLYDIGWTGGHCPDIASTRAAPVASDQSVSTAKDTAVTITLAATDPGGNTLSYSVVAAPAHGQLSGGGVTRTYTPDTGYTGADSFTFEANDGFASSNVATVSISVTAPASGGSSSQGGSQGGGGGGGGGALGGLTAGVLGLLALLTLRQRRGRPRRAAAPGARGA